MLRCRKHQLVMAHSPGHIPPIATMTTHFLAVMSIGQMKKNIQKTNPVITYSKADIHSSPIGQCPTAAPTPINQATSALPRAPALPGAESGATFAAGRPGRAAPSRQQPCAVGQLDARCGVISGVAETLAGLAIWPFLESTAPDASESRAFFGLPLV